ncbi:MAG: peptide chain release factor N(5)-glutamine methyltransferase [Christensenellaceae bacterium]|nr:peptide chain release factor N(5)-glutamine methyltransferase [Christensenellaceae bacterium]
MSSVAEALHKTASELLPAAGEEAAQQARLLVCHVLGLHPSALAAQLHTVFPAQYQAALQACIRRRLAREPLQYIVGEWEFMGLPFAVREGALIPRQDTETLCEAVLAKVDGGRLLDLCCGTGCIGISLAVLGGFEVTLADISPACLKLAAQNAARHGVRAKVLRSDMFQAVGEGYDVICCNPPYIPAGELAALQPEVQREPKLALCGGEDGLTYYRRIAAGYAAHLKPGGLLALEVGQGQAGAVLRLLGGGETKKDVCGVERVVLYVKGEGL